MKKRILALLLGAALTLSLLAACGQADAGDAGPSDSPDASVSPSDEPSQAPAPSDEPSAEPTPDADQEPSEEPSEEPSQQPSQAPSQAPEDAPSPAPEAPATVDLAAFYADTYDALFPLDADGNPTGPFTDDVGGIADYMDNMYPGLTAISTNQCHVYMPMMTGVPFEIALIEVADAADVEAVKAILQARIDTEVANQMNYPAVIENWELNSRVVSNGNYILMAVCETCDAFVDSFNALF